MDRTRRAWVCVATMFLAPVAWWCWLETMTGPARESARPVMVALMMGQAVPSGWTTYPGAEEGRNSSYEDAGPPTEAYIVRSSGYPGRHHFNWVGLSRRKGVWWHEEAQFNADKGRFHYGAGKAQAWEVDRLLAEVDRQATEKGLKRADLNLVR